MEFRTLPSGPPDDAPVTMTLPAGTWRLVNLCFLPTNPNKMRGPHKETARQAALDFRSEFYAALARAAAKKETG